MNRSFKFKKLGDWERVDGKDLCGDCYNQVKEFIEGSK